MEDKFRQGDPKSACEGIKPITRCGKQNNSVVSLGGVATFLSDLNNFYARFDNNDFTGVNRELGEILKITLLLMRNYIRYYCC